MSKAFIAAILQDSFQSTGVAALKGAEDVIDAIVGELLAKGSFTLPSFGAFTVHDTPARNALNPRTGEPVKVAAGATVRYKASPVLKAAVKEARAKASGKKKAAPAKAKAAKVAAPATPAARGRKKA
ncbi:HU family DNA-binding protein [Acetobacter sacchari]|uniref:HU family DNA-binding protein n=1 Tax=Acetobacter sacchari TaxID=2661687 RepID=A0ABS3LWZ2_9PROT|nr:HU family DNA-binding protein [Acetobacter sacchari]